MLHTVRILFYFLEDLMHPVCALPLRLISDALMKNNTLEANVYNIHRMIWKDPVA
jgi:hypothetical protein